jgi:alginate O-acetyltransferase complex protein AlgI
MPFSSLNFLLLLPVIVVVFWALPLRFQRHWLLVSSAVVYLYAGWTDLGLLAGITTLNWLTTRLWPARARLCHAMVVADLVFLGWFKYRYFLGGIIGHGHPGAELIIPLGISFYVFQLISYQIEIARGVIEAPPGFYAFFLYIFFFPHHQAGPIMRPHAFLICFEKPRHWARSRFQIGVILVLWGLFKKVWLADLIAPVANRAFEAFHLSRGAAGNVFYLSVLYGIQIYADFSGYSDIAVGLGRMLGFKLDRNFHQPYTATGASEFWQRWHITLSQWLRDHVYIPLGGNRRGMWRTLVNLMITMLVGGLWHGAGWAFLIWGGLHGLYLVIQRFLPEARGAFARSASYVTFQILAMLTWLPFREVSIGAIARGMTRWSGWVSPELPLAAALFIGILLFSHLEQALERRFVKLLKTVNAVPPLLFPAACSLILYLVLFGGGRATTFIYQRF